MKDTGRAPYTARFTRYKAEYSEEFATLDEAVSYLAWGEERGELSCVYGKDVDGTIADCVFDADGVAVANAEDVFKAWLALA
jgi:hypothetical protein